MLEQIRDYRAQGYESESPEAHARRVANEALAVLDAPSLPVGGGDGEANERMCAEVWALLERAGALRGGLVPSVAALLEDHQHLLADRDRMRVKYEGFPAFLAKQPPAGDEAREALARRVCDHIAERYRANGMERRFALGDARMVLAALESLSVAWPSSPLPGAGDGRAVAARIADGLIAFERRLPVGGARITFRDLNADELRELVLTLAADEKETTR